MLSLHSLHLQGSSDHALSQCSRFIGSGSPPTGQSSGLPSSTAVHLTISWSLSPFFEHLLLLSLLPRQLHHVSLTRHISNAFVCWICEYSRNLDWESASVAEAAGYVSPWMSVSDVHRGYFILGTSSSCLILRGLICLGYLISCYAVQDVADYY
jgi:hypothetical protein